MICGAGKVIQTPRGASYSLSQRAEHIWEGVSSATTRSRPIINTRDEPHADAERFRRLHVIVGDSNMSETTTLLKVGTTDLVLRMIEAGVVMRDLIRMAGGLREGRSLQAVLLGGAAGSFVTEANLDVPLSFEGTRAIGATLGSGAVMVLDDTADLGPILLRIARFFSHESCGQCVPCRVGTKRQEEILARMLAARHENGHDGDIALLADVAQAMRDASICGLGQTAASAIQSAVVQLGVGR